MENNYFGSILPEIRQLTDLCVENSVIDPELYGKYEVKRGLRDLNGKGVLTGLTHISDIRAAKTVDGQSVPCEGKLYYRGINIEDIIRGFAQDKRFGFEETTYLLQIGRAHF